MAFCGLGVIALEILLLASSFAYHLCRCRKRWRESELFGGTKLSFFAQGAGCLVGVVSTIDAF
jgi:hypothetical protein